MSDTPGPGTCILFLALPRGCHALCASLLRVCGLAITRVSCSCLRHYSPIRGSGCRAAVQVDHGWVGLGRGSELDFFGEGPRDKVLWRRIIVYNLKVGED